MKQFNTSLLENEEVLMFDDLNIKIELREGGYGGHFAKATKIQTKARFPRPVFYYSFRNEDKRNEYVANYVNKMRENKTAHEEQKTQRKADREQPSKLKVGDVLRDSWGYDQTQVDYYQVSALVGPRTVKVRQMSATSVEATSGMSDRVVPGEAYGPEHIARVKYGDWINVPPAMGLKGHTATLDEGTPSHRSWYA